jgi:hypothetical protein
VTRAVDRSHDLMSSSVWSMPSRPSEPTPIPFARGGNVAPQYIG